MGYAGEDVPSLKIPAVVGRPKTRSHAGFDTKSEYIGDEALSKKSAVSLNYPIECGVITNWDDMEMIWEHCFANVLKVDSSDMKVILTEPPRNPKANREKMVRLFFETFRVECYYVSLPDPLACYSNGRTTGLVC